MDYSNREVDEFGGRKVLLVIGIGSEGIMAGRKMIRYFETTSIVLIYNLQSNFYAVFRLVVKEFGIGDGTYSFGTKEGKPDPLATAIQVSVGTQKQRLFWINS